MVPFSNKKFHAVKFGKRLVMKPGIAVTGGKLRQKIGKGFFYFLSGRLQPFLFPFNGGIIFEGDLDARFNS